MKKIIFMITISVFITSCLSTTVKAETSVTATKFQSVNEHKSIMKVIDESFRLNTKILDKLIFETPKVNDYSKALISKKLVEDLSVPGFFITDDIYKILNNKIYNLYFNYITLNKKNDENIIFIDAKKKEIDTLNAIISSTNDINNSHILKHKEVKEQYEKTILDIKSTNTKQLFLVGGLSTIISVGTTIIVFLLLDKKE
jgi:hypothetical protein